MASLKALVSGSGVGAMLEGAVRMVASLEAPAGRLMGLYWCSWVEGRYD